MVTLEWWSVLRRKNDHVREVVSFMEGGHVTEVVSLKEGEWLCYGGCHFNGGRKVIRGSEVVGLMEGE